MTTYLSQLVDRIPLIGADGVSSGYLRTKQEKTPKLKYITIYNADYVSGKGESNEELADQILCFVSDNNDGDVLEANKVEQIRTIGLIQALDGLPHSFLQDPQDDYSGKVIHASKSTIIIKRLEKSFVLACSISIPEGGVKHAAINQQMISLINRSYEFFRILNTSFTNLVENYNTDILKNLMVEHWTGFLNNYNSENFRFPPTVKWPNSLNYRGFLGFFDTIDSGSHFSSDFRVYKKSSIELNYNMKYQMDELLRSGSGSVPQALFVSYFDKSVPKKYGLIYAKSAYVESLQEPAIQHKSLVDIYNYLEYFDYHDKLNTRDLVRLRNDDLFSSPQTMKANINTEYDTEANGAEGERNFLRDGANFAIDLLNPINLTNNLVVSPINYTMNSMMNLRLEAANTGAASWFKVPSYLQFGSAAGAPEEEEDEEDEGRYLVGAVSSSDDEQQVIERKLIYLTTKVKHGTETVEEEREYSMVMYVQNDILITLLYDSSASELDNVDFYTNLKDTVLRPTADDIDEFIRSSETENLESSVGSLPRSVNGLASAGEGITDQIDSDFFFIIYDDQNKSVKSSLPYLPVPLNLEQVHQLDKPNLNVRSAMFYLHDQLLDLFFLQKTPFFAANSIHEYFHKFSTNKINDWMFYYLRHEDRYIIIMKNVNHNAKRKKRGPSPVKTPSISEHSPNVDFLSNLGDDVKYWFENYVATGDT